MTLPDPKEVAELVDLMDTGEAIAPNDLRIVVNVARAYAESNETQWCISHSSVWMNPKDGCEATLSAQVKAWRRPCECRTVHLILEDTDDPL